MALVLRAGFSLLRNPAHPREPHPAWNPSPPKPAHGCFVLPPGACRMLLFAGVSSRALVGSWNPRIIGIGEGALQNPALHATCAKIKLCLRVLFAPSMFRCDFPLLCFCVVFPLYIPQGRLCPGSCVGYSRSVTPVVAQCCSKSVGATVHPSPQPWKPALSSPSTRTAPRNGKHHQHPAWLLPSDPNKNGGKHMVPCMDPSWISCSCDRCSLVVFALAEGCPSG